MTSATQRLYLSAPSEKATEADRFGSYLHTSIGAEIVSTWHASGDVEKYPQDASTRAEKLTEDLSQIDRATVFVCLTCGGRPVTTLCELGYAVARGIPVVWVHGAKDESALFDAHANVTVFITENPFRVVDRVAEWIRQGGGVKVGELRKALEGVDDELEIVVRAWDDDNDYCGSIGAAEVELTHDEDDSPFFAIDCWPDEEDEGDAIAEDDQAAPEASKG